MYLFIGIYPHNRHDAEIYCTKTEKKTGHIKKSVFNKTKHIQRLTEGKT